VKSKREKEFHKLFAQLPTDVQKQAKKAYLYFKDNPYHPSLHFKCIDEGASIYSVRVGRNYRAVGVWKGDTISWYWIGSHEDYNNLY
jgi:hypothetical protein